MIHVIELSTASRQSEVAFLSGVEKVLECTRPERAGSTGAWESLSSFQEFLSPQVKLLCYSSGTWGGLYGLLPWTFGNNSQNHLPAPSLPDQQLRRPFPTTLHFRRPVESDAGTAFASQKVGAQKLGHPPGAYILSCLPSPGLSACCLSRIPCFK